VPDGSNQNQVLIQQYTDNGGPNQQFRLSKVANGWVRIINTNNKSLDIPNSSPNDGVQIQQYGSHNGYNQQWRLIRAN
jgi:hypothetical protein